MFSHYPSRYTSSPYDSYYVDPYQAALAQRQRQIELARRERALREQEAARLAEARRIQQLRRQQEETRLREEYLEQLRNQQRRRSPYYYQQPEAEEEEDAEEQEYYQHPFFPFSFVPRRQQPSSPQPQQPSRRPSPPQPVSDAPMSVNDTSEADESILQTQQPPRSASPVKIPIMDPEAPKSAQATEKVSNLFSAHHFVSDHDIDLSSVQSARRSPSPATPIISTERLNEAAFTIQSQWRSYALRQRALSQINNIRSSFTNLQSTFTFPSTVDFTDATSPTLAFTANNRPILVYEHTATGLLTKLDAVDSAGDANVRKARKALVNEIEAAIREVDEKKLAAWEAQRMPALTSTTEEQTIAPECEMVDAEEPQAVPEAEPLAVVDDGEDIVPDTEVPNTVESVVEESSAAVEDNTPATLSTPIEEQPSATPTNPTSPDLTLSSYLPSPAQPTPTLPLDSLESDSEDGVIVDNPSSSHSPHPINKEDNDGDLEWVDASEEAEERAVEMQLDDGLPQIDTL